jgi:arylsulfatase
VIEECVPGCNMFAYIDGDVMAKPVATMRQPDRRTRVHAAAKDGSLPPDRGKRGAIRSVFDGRQQFTRHFSPRQHDRPASLESLFELNDVELHDLARDPDEAVDLAMARSKHGERLLAMNEKLNELIDGEVGEDVGQRLPERVDGGWGATDAVLGLLEVVGHVTGEREDVLLDLQFPLCRRRGHAR